MEQILTNTCYEYTPFYAFPDTYNYDIILHEYLYTMYKCIHVHVHVYNIDIIHTCIIIYTNHGQIIADSTLHEKTCAIL